jgi:hypothetical protein
MKMLPTLTCLRLTGLFLLVAGPAAGLTPEAEKAMDAYLQAHLADEFTTPDVIRLVELKVDSDLLVKEIAYRVSKNIDLTFSVSDADLDRIKRAGASNDLIEALRSPISAVRYTREHPPDLRPANTAKSPVQITSEEGGYSLEYPAQPEKKDLAQKGSHGSTYVVMSDNVIYTSGHVVYEQDVGVDSELEGNATNVAKEIDAKVTEKKPTRFIRARGDELPALECTIESDKLLGRCLSVVDGRRSYVVGGFSMKPHNGQAEIDRFLKSFKLASSAAGAASATVSPFATPSPVQASTVLPQTAPHASDFEEKVQSLGLVFKPPEGYQVVTPKENRDMKYDYALRHPTKKYEIRYALQPFPKGMLEEYKQWSEKKDKGDAVMTDPNLMFKMAFQTIRSNIAGKGEVLGSQDFNPASVKAHFGGDSGAMALVCDMTSQFAGDFVCCTMIGIHKKDFGQIYIFHMCDDVLAVKEEMDLTNFSLRFPIEPKESPAPRQ